MPVKHSGNEQIKLRDLALVKASLAGNTRAFAQLMRLYRQRVFIFGKSFFHNDADAEDFVQDVFIKVYTHLSTFQGKSQFSTWLMKIAYTTVLNSVSRKKEYLPISDEENIADFDMTPEERQIRLVTQKAIHEALMELPEKYALCIELYFFYSIPYQEISDITEIPLNTIKSHIFRAKKILREKLEDFYEKSR